MSDRPDKNVVVVGGGYAGFQVAKDLSKKLDPKQYNLILINSRSYSIALPAVVRLVVDPHSNLEETSFVALDRLYAKGNGQTKVGVVTKIEVEKGQPGGTVVLASDERIPYAVLVLATGAKWTGPCDIPHDESTVLKFVTDWRSRFAIAKHVVIVGGGAVGIELAGEVKDVYPNKKVTIVHRGTLLVNKVYNKSFRNGMQHRLEARGVQVILDDSLDMRDDVTVVSDGVSVVTGKGTCLEDADLLVSARGGGPNTEYLASLDDVLNDHKFVLVGPTLQLSAHPSIFALGDIIAWPEQKQAAKLHWQNPVVVANVIDFLNGVTPSKKYTRAPEMIVVTNGRKGGMGYFEFCGGFTLGDWFAWLTKSRNFMVPQFRKELGY